MSKMINVIKPEKTREELIIDLESLKTTNKRIRFELENVERREYQLKERVEYLERQLKTANELLHSVSQLLNLKIIETKNEIETRKVIK